MNAKQCMAIRHMIVAVILLSILAIPGSVRAVELTFVPHEVDTHPLEQFSVTVHAADLDSLRGYAVEVAFDSDVVDFVSATRGELFSHYAPPQGLYWATQDRDSVVRVECFIVPQDECVAGPGDILVLTFQAIDEAAGSALHFGYASVRDCDGSPILPIVTEDGVVNVGPWIELGFEPQTYYASYPETFEIALQATDLDTLRSAVLEVEFDPAIVDFVEAQPGAIFDGHLLNWSVTDLGNAARIECALSTPGDCVPGSGEIAVLVFDARDVHGESPLHVRSAVLRDCEDQALPGVRMIDGSIVVGAVTELFFDPDPKYVLGSRPFEISLEIAPVDSLRGFQVFISYDSAAVEFDSAFVGDIWIEPLWWYVTRESAGSARIEGVILGPDLFVEGPGELARLEFEAVIDSGSTEVVFDTWHVWDVTADEFLPVAVDDGLILIDWHWQGVGEDEIQSPPRLILDAPRGSPGQGPFLFDGVCDHQRPPMAMVLDLSGRRLRTLGCEMSPAARFHIAWDGRDARGRPVSPGVYWLRVSSGENSTARAVVIVR